ncbi:MAG: hypothetical protein UW03_C0020G0038 [Candidatus Peregrinibacteria bacterium GW2011_GWA2_43_8]|nr:MAG: hypothetical protein UW03_C0020G0038 [Candidatus Peregrinibacteria bacterium GW2011_GWA2_43_8]
MSLFAEKIVFSALVTACLFAVTPTILSSSFIETTEGVVLWPSTFGITVGSPPSIIATQELVVPRSMPMILDMGLVVL